MPRRERLDLLTFGMAMLAGLTRRDITVLSMARTEDIHQGFVEAFKVVEAELGREKLGFWMTTHEIYGVSQDVFNIFRYYLSSGYATVDWPDGSPFRFSMGKDEATRLLEEEVEGGIELYDRATDVFLNYIRSHHVVT